MIVLDGGRATAAAVPGADLLIIEDMGHYLAEAHWPQIVEAIAANTRRIDSAVTISNCVRRERPTRPAGVSIRSHWLRPVEIGSSRTGATT